MCKSDPEATAVNLAAQLIVHHGYAVEEVARGALKDRIAEVDAEVDRLSIERSKASTQYHVKFSPDELRVRKLSGFTT